MFKILLSFCIIFCFTNNSLADGELFYQDPSYERIKGIINVYANNVATTSADTENLTKHLSVIFYFYPNLIKDIEPDIQNYSTEIRQSIAQSIINTNGWNENLPENYKSLQPNKLNMNINFLIYSSPEETNFNYMLTDFFIQVFYISGDSKYLEKILKFINNFPRDVKYATRKKIYDNAPGHEMDELYAKMTKHHVTLTSQLENIINFLDKKRAEQPLLDATINEVIANNKKYDYRNDA